MSKIFLSYAHIDNETAEPSQTGWISYFAKALNYELQQNGHKGEDVWRDAGDIRPHEQFAERIDDGLNKAELFVAVVSPNYIKRDWCKKELSEFGDACNIADSNSRERVFKVLKKHVETERHPALLQGQEGYKFFAFDPEKRREIPFYHPGRGADDRFWDLISWLAQDVSNQIGTFKGEDEAEPSNGGSERSVFLAYSTEDMSDSARRIRAELEQLEFKVYPSATESAPMTLEGLDACFQKYLSSCEFTVHCIGATPGFSPDGSNDTLVELQLEAAKSKQLKRVIWVPDGIRRDSSTALQSVLEDLQSGEELNERDDLLETGVEQLLGFFKDIAASSDTQEQETPEDLIERLKNTGALSEEELEKLSQKLKGD